VTIGILVAYLVGLAFDGIEGWRWMLGLGCVPALALAFGMLRMPQSPRWLVMTGDDFAARATLAKIRVDDPDTIDRELEEIKESLDEKPGAWRELLRPVVKVRSKAAGIGTMANWTFNFIVSLTFLLLIEALGRSGAFWFYGAIGILTLVFCWKLVPETKGQRLEDIQAFFQARVDRRAA
jgi:MFS family permease